jgi:cyanophycin synthetase
MDERMLRQGFWPGVRQPAYPISMRVVQPGELDFRALDAWLVQHLCMVLEAPPPFRHTDAAVLGVSALVWRILQLGIFLQQEALTPVFGVGRITQVLADPTETGVWRVKVLVPCTDFLTRKALFLAYIKAMECIDAVIHKAAEPLVMASILERLDKSAVRPLRALNKSGISTVPVLKEASRQDIPYRHLGDGVYQLGWGQNARLLDRSVIDTDASIGSKLVNMKHWTAQWLRAAGLPAPAHTLVASEAEAMAAAQSMGWPLVVKPADRERSEGVTVSVSDMPTLVQGFRSAAQLSKLILVERHVPGVCFRLMVADGAFLYAVRRRPVAVFGDGQATVAQLVERARLKNEQQPPWRRSKPITVDDLCVQALSVQNKTPGDVPAPGERVALRLIESTEWGGDVEDATADVHPENAAIAVRAAGLFRLGNAGVDIITTDVSIPWHQSGAIINEVNFAPHFGGTSTARRMMPVFLKSYVADDGRIPVEVFVGGHQAMLAGRSRQKALRAEGRACFLTSHEQTLDQHGALLAMAADGLFDRVLALLMNRDVGALVLVIQTDELLRTGLPVDRLASVQVVGGEGAAGWSGKGPVGLTMPRLLQLLRAHVGVRARHA